MMTTMAALLGTLPIAGVRTRWSARQALGLAVVSERCITVLTLYITPVIYLYLEGFRYGWDEQRHAGRKLSKSPPD
jgi:multidrug efflux pump subunit AcrB